MNLYNVRYRLSLMVRHWAFHLTLFLLTLGATTVVGALFYGNARLTDSWASLLAGGLTFSAPLMTILLAHEMGHYLSARRFGLNATLPYFIPAIPPLGTMGAFIKIRSPIPDPNALMRVGALGPLAGAAFAIPFLIFGLWHSEAQGPAGPEMGLTFGNSVILELCSRLKFGPDHHKLAIILHPTGVAAWFGLFVTAMNLLPIGQLDGGHVVYALFGQRVAGIVSMCGLVALAALGFFCWPGWIIFGTLTVVIGYRHPPPLYPEVPLDGTGKLIGYVAVLLFVLCFVPIPLSFSGLDE